MMSFNRPKFITFEGGEGSGKSTQSKLLYEYLLSKRIKVIHTREVGGTVEAEKIRNLLVYSELMPMSELMLVMAARYEHINKVIVPALLNGSWVICDRYVDSTACYQSGDSGLTIEDIFELHAKLMTVSYANEAENISHPEVEIHDYCKHGIMPDLTFFMDVPPALGLERVAARGDANKFEAKNIAFHNMIYDRFKAIAEMHKGRIISIECVGRSIDEIHRSVTDRIFY
ncbi:MAG: dTMP kinase [Rickettsiaceae bacterium]